MIKDIFLHKTLCRGIFMIAGLFVFLSAGAAHATCNGVDYSSAYNNYGGFFNAPNYPNHHAFAALDTNGHITTWGNSSYGGTAPTNATTDTFTAIYSTGTAFAALDTNGHITAWGDSSNGGTAPVNAQLDTFTAIYSTGTAFAALKSDGSITAWGNETKGGSGAPTGNGYTQIYSTGTAFAALDADGHITAWGSGSAGGLSPDNAQTDIFTTIYSTSTAFAAIDVDGYITTWGNPSSGGSGAPTDSGYTKIYSAGSAFAVISSDNSIYSWGWFAGGSGAPSGNNYVSIYTTNDAFAALTSDGSIATWGNETNGGSGAPTGNGYTQIYSTGTAFAALDADGFIHTWGNGTHGAPTDSGYVKVYSTYGAFAALKSDGSITVWGDSNSGGSGAPSGTGYTQIYSTQYAFAALDTNGHITTWGDSSYGGTGAPTGTGYTIPYGGSCTSGDSGSSDVTIEDPNTTKIQNAIDNNHISLDNGTIDNTTQTTTQTNITFESTNANALFPTGTVITEAEGGNYNFQNFTIADTNIPNTATAINLGIPGTNLSFSEDITVTLKPGEQYNDQTLNVYSQSTGQTDWTLHTTCTVSEGDCTFTTNHATIYTAGGIPGAMPIDINVEVQDTLTLDCFDTATGTGDLNVTLGTTTDPGKVTAGTPAVGQSTCTVTTNDDQGYYLTLMDDNAATNTVLTHTDPHTGSTYEIQDLTQFPTTTTWTTPTTKGLGFSVVTFPDTQTDNNTLDETWTNTNQCPEGTNPDTNTYAGIPDTAETISAVTQYESLSTTTNICYKVDVPASQASGVYQGSVTYTATSDASSYLN